MKSQYTYMIYIAQNTVHYKKKMLKNLWVYFLPELCSFCVDVITVRMYCMACKNSEIQQKCILVLLTKALHILYDTSA